MARSGYQHGFRRSQGAPAESRAAAGWLLLVGAHIGALGLLWITG